MPSAFENLLLDVSVNAERSRWQLDPGMSGAAGEPVTVREVEQDGVRS